MEDRNVKVQRSSSGQTDDETEINNCTDDNNSPIGIEFRSRDSSVEYFNTLKGLPNAYFNILIPSIIFFMKTYFRISYCRKLKICLKDFASYAIVKKRAIPGLFLIIFVFPVQLTVNKCSI